jgi:hypothetical protein
MPGMLVLLDLQWGSLFRETKDSTLHFLILYLDCNFEIIYGMVRMLRLYIEHLLRCDSRAEVGRMQVVENLPYLHDLVVFLSYIVLINKTLVTKS